MTRKGIADYKAAGSGLKPFANAGISGTAPYAELFNGNIGAMSVNIPALGDALLTIYRYDQLNRLTRTFTYEGLNSTTNSWNKAGMEDYREQVSYDGNGNILTYKRNGDAARNRMDDLKYSYVPGTNKLHKVEDSAPDVVDGYEKYNDIRGGQQDENYQYDAIGNLVQDRAEGILKVEWDVYGKIRRIQKKDVEVSYRYDAGGNRIWKKVGDKETFYVRDANGNVLSIYTINGAGSELKQSEVHLYGSSRLGILNLDRSVEKPEVNRSGIVTFRRGNKFFELSNHLGNVLATVSDKKLAVSGDGSTVDYYEAEVVSAQDYYPFGMMMPGRTFNAGSGSYRYGFGNKEKDNEIKGIGNSYDFGARMYDPRIGRWLSVDPLAVKYPDASPYNYALNSPIQAVDPDGNLVIFINGQHLGHEGGTRRYWEGVDKRIMRRIGDYNAIYRDGASGGFLNTIFNSFGNNNLNIFSRIGNGYTQGKKDAASVIAGLKRDPNDPDKIVETVKVISHSMGTAYSRGYTAALEQYVTEYNTSHKDAQLSGFKIETQVDIAAFQGSYLPADKNVQNRFFMSGDADGVANGKGKLKAISPSSDVPNATQIPTESGIEHGIINFGKDKYIQQIPQSSNNSDFMRVQMPQPSQRDVPDATRTAPKPQSIIPQKNP